VLGIGISPDGATLATLPFDGPVILWDLAEYKAIVEVGGSGGFDTSDVDFSPDGQFIAADLATGLSVWKASDQTLLWSGINSMAFAYSPDGRFLAYSDIGENNNVVLSSPDGTQRIRTLEGHQGPVWAMIFSPDSTRLVSADGIEIRIWQVEDGELLYVGKPACP
jgi:WD40 repeat protein